MSFIQGELSQQSFVVDITGKKLVKDLHQQRSIISVTAQQWIAFGVMLWKMET